MDQPLSINCTPERFLQEIISGDHGFDADLLARFDFDAALWLEQMRAVREHRLNESSAQINDDFEPAADLRAVNYDSRSDEQIAHSIGVQALSRGEVAILVLNGGLATRFG